MNIMYDIIKPYKCPNCGQDMLFFETRNNTVIDYKAFLSLAKSISETKEFLEKRDVKHFKCVYCDSKYIIDWTTGWPTPIVDKEKLRQFGY